MQDFDARYGRKFSTRTLLSAPCEAKPGGRIGQWPGAFRVPWPLGAWVRPLVRRLANRPCCIIAGLAARVNAKGGGKSGEDSEKNGREKAHRTVWAGRRALFGPRTGWAKAAGRVRSRALFRPMGPAGRARQRRAAPCGPPRSSRRLSRRGPYPLPRPCAQLGGRCAHLGRLCIALFGPSPPSAAMRVVRLPFAPRSF